MSTANRKYIDSVFVDLFRDTSHYTGSIRIKLWNQYRFLGQTPNTLVEISPAAACFDADTERDGEFDDVFHLLF